MTTENSYPSIELRDIVNPQKPESVFEEVQRIFELFLPEIDLSSVRTIFRDTVQLFNGDYPGYRACTTPYHDLCHTLETFLAQARLIHGYHCDGNTLSCHSISLGLISALFHDTGYIQTIMENHGTGAKYTMTHIKRSIDFTEKYFFNHSFDDEDTRFVEGCILLTNINTSVDNISFSSDEERILACMLGTSDLLSQIADRSYLENLALLYSEFSEGNVSGFDSEIDLYRKTVSFFDVARARFRDKLADVNRYMTKHFQARLSQDEDLYALSIGKNEQYLKHLLYNEERDIFDGLRRDGIIDRLRGKA